MALKPRSLNCACSHLAGQDNLEGALAQVDLRRDLLSRWIRQQSVKAIALPVELLLHRNHLAKDSLSKLPRLSQVALIRNRHSTDVVGEIGRMCDSVLVEQLRQMKRAAGGKGKLLESRAGELVEVLEWCRPLPSAVLIDGASLVLK